MRSIISEEDSFAVICRNYRLNRQNYLELDERSSRYIFVRLECSDVNQDLFLQDQDKTKTPSCKTKTKTSLDKTKTKTKTFKFDQDQDRDQDHEYQDQDQDQDLQFKNRFRNLIFLHFCRSTTI